VTTVITILVKITIDALTKSVVSCVVVNQDGWVGPVLPLITVLTKRVKIMPRVQIMEIHTRANVVTDGLEVNVNLKIFVYITHVNMAVNVKTTVVTIYVVVLKDGSAKTIVALTTVQRNVVTF
jgi:hypothetical protein